MNSGKAPVATLREIAQVPVGEPAVNGAEAALFFLRSSRGLAPLQRRQVWAVKVSAPTPEKKHPDPEIKSARVLAAVVSYPLRRFGPYRLGPLGYPSATHPPSPDIPSNEAERCLKP